MSFELGSSVPFSVLFFSFEQHYFEGRVLNETGD